MEFSSLDVFVVVLVSLVTYRIYKRWKIQSGLPPSPSGAHWLLGHRIDMKTALQQFQCWQKDMGDIYTINIMGKNIVMLSGETEIYEALVTKTASFSGRPSAFRADAIHNFQGSIGMGNDTPLWKDMKTAMVTCLKMYGEHLKNLEALALESIKVFIQNIQKKNGEPFDPDLDIYQLVLEIMGQLVCSRLLTDTEVKQLTFILKEADVLLNPVGEGYELEALPFLRHFKNQAWKKIQKIAQMSTVLYENLIQERKEVFKIENPQCLIDALLRHQTKERHPSGKPKVSDAYVKMIADEVVFAGVMTTQMATYSFIALMTEFPEVQKKLQKEVDDVVGARQPRLKDRPNMPYTEATISEVLRYTTETPLLVPHMTTNDEIIKGYFIPKGTQVWINVYNLHHDERYWTDPWSFVPERFLDEDGKLVPADHPNRKRFLIFGAGRRHCPGEALARNRLFLFVTSFMQNFTFTAAKGEEKPNNDPGKRIPGIVTCIPAYKARALTRGE